MSDVALFFKKIKIKYCFVVFHKMSSVILWKKKKRKNYCKLQILQSLKSIRCLKLYTPLILCKSWIFLKICSTIFAIQILLHIIFFCSILNITKKKYHHIPHYKTETCLEVLLLKSSLKNLCIAVSWDMLQCIVIEFQQFFRFKDYYRFIF